MFIELGYMNTGFDDFKYKLSICVSIASCSISSKVEGNIIFLVCFKLKKACFLIVLMSSGTWQIFWLEAFAYIMTFFFFI